MSNLLNESIVDAKALRDSALKNAESVVIEKYAEEVKKTLENLLEQDEPSLGLDPVGEAPPPADDAAAAPTEEVVSDQSDTVPLAATDGLDENEGDNLSSTQNEGEDVEVTVDLGALQEAIEALSSEIDEEIELDVMSEDEESVSEEEINEEETEIVDEEIDMTSLFDAVMEKLTADMGAELSGWAGTPTSQLRHEQDRQLAHEASTESEEEEALEEEQEEVKESNEKLERALAENESLKEELVNYQSTLDNLKENLYEVNLSNARLLYTNRVLRNSSLNERQKDKIVEAISGAGSVKEAKTIFETLQSTVEAKPKKSPQSLSEAISGRSSVLTASRKETKATSHDPFSDRMRRLAGIK